MKAYVFSPEQIAITRENGWLVLDWPLPSQCPPPDRLLALNDASPESEKFCMARDGSYHLRTEIPVSSDDGDGDDRVEPSLVAMHRAIAALHHDGFPIELSVADGDIPDLAAICQESGWPCVERASGRWMVELETAAFCQAEITTRASMLDVAVSVAESESPEACCVEATTHLLLAASSAFRMIRTSRLAVGSEQRPRLLARVAISHVRSDLPRALCALSIAARSLLREVQSLQNAAIAGSYLAFAVSPLAGRTTNPDDRKSSMSKEKLTHE